MYSSLPKAVVTIARLGNTRELHLAFHAEGPEVLAALTKQVKFKASCENILQQWQFVAESSLVRLILNTSKYNFPLRQDSAGEDTARIECQNTIAIHLQCFREDSVLIGIFVSLSVPVAEAESTIYLLVY